jgi:oligosaccharide reducing-end xylanase
MVNKVFKEFRMNRKTGNFVAFLFSASLVSAVIAGTIEAPFEVGTWGNFAKGAISHTFDDYPNDNTSDQATTGRSAFNEYKLHMTLFVQVGSISNWKPLQDAFADGHEIASHNWSHNVNSGDFAKSQKEIQTKVPGEKCVTLAYPNCSASDDAALLKVYIAARNCAGAYNNASPSKMAQIGGQLIGDKNGGGNTASYFNAFADNAAKDNKWAVLGSHGINGMHGWANTSVPELKKHLEYMDKNRDKIWCETFGNVARYIKERDAASLKVKSSADTKITVELTDNLADSIFNYPLTVRRPLPDGWTTASVSQKDKAVDDSIITVDSKKYVMFKAVPDGGDIVISKDGSTYVDKRIMDNSPINTVVIYKSSLAINPASFSGSSISVSLFDLKGELVAHYSYSRSTNSISVPLNSLANSAFVVKITDGKTMVVNRCLSQM